MEQSPLGTDLAGDDRSVVLPGAPEGSRTWLDEWWAIRRWEFIQERLNREARDPGLPAYPWLPDGTPIMIGDGDVQGPMPVSFVALAREKPHPVMNLSRLRWSVMEALFGWEGAKKMFS